MTPAPDPYSPKAHKHPTRGFPAAVWPYVNEGGVLAFTACRFPEPDGRKAVLPQEKDGRWSWPPAPRPLYNLPELLARPSAPVLFSEGEKAAEAARLLFPGYVVTTTSAGSGRAGETDFAPLRGRRVLLWPDHDDPGRSYAGAVAGLALDAGAVSVAIVRVPNGFPPGWDVADPQSNGCGLECLRFLLDAAAPFAPPAPSPTLADLRDGTPFAEVEAALRRAGAAGAGRDPIARGFARVQAIRDLKRLGVEGPAKLADLAFPNVGAAGNEKQGTELLFPDVEPWPDPVDGAALLSDLAAYARRFAVLPKGGAETFAAYVVFTWTKEAFDVAPILALLSPEKRCGKSTVLALLAGVVPRALAVSGVSTAALFRTVEAYKPTMLIDEADGLGEENEELRKLINAGHTRTSAFVIRCVGDDLEPKVFNVWGPKVLAAIGRLPSTVEDRAIVIPMKRKTKAEKTERTQARNLEAAAADLRRQAARWAADNLGALRSTWPETPEALNDRAADNWEPLLAIGGLAGGEWSERLPAAALLLSGDADGATESFGVMALADCRIIFQETGRDSLPSALLREHLLGMETRPWADFNKGRGISTNGLARLLRPFGVAPKTIRTDDGRTPKGYTLASFADAWECYTPAIAVDPPSATATPQQTATSQGFGGSDNRNAAAAVAVAETTETRARVELLRCGGLNGGDPVDPLDLKALGGNEDAPAVAADPRTYPPACAWPGCRPSRVERFGSRLRCEPAGHLFDPPPTEPAAEKDLTC